MSMLIQVGSMFPNMALARPDGTGMELYDLWKQQHALLLFQKEPHGLFKIPKRLFFAAAARGNIQLQGLGNKGTSLFENPGGELNLHKLVRLRLVLEA